MSINPMDINYVLNSAETDTNSIDEEQAPFESSTEKSYQSDDVTQPAIPHHPLSEDMSCPGYEGLCFCPWCPDRWFGDDEIDSHIVGHLQEVNQAIWVDDGKDHSTTLTKMVHMIVARQSTSWPGEGRMKELADHIKQQLPSSDSEALQYPAYGDIWRYRSSVFTGDKAMVTAITTYTSHFPDSKIVLLGYSQGAHIIGDILCGSIVERDFPAIPPIEDRLGKRIVAAVSMGDPTFIPGLPYDFGTSKHTGVRLSSPS
ncbi:Alpha/Beta hydrolase protein [Aspergillus minisclerotigenes]|uniref:Alpha/Beta hydrolase protein n=1 Tax=Aspergillus minisclerotigenes TaxID=656917 RepID=A0A5N6J4Z6_9EURO|nr:Alpha/Beta hydrolase protein [Aspergillus minisclerotigenes]